MLLENEDSNITIYVTNLHIFIICFIVNIMHNTFI